MLKIIAGKFKNKKLSVPKNIRPATATVRDAIFNIARYQIEEAYFLDLFSGSGAIGLEALSRGASHTTFIDKSPISIRYIKENIKNLNLEKTSKIICQDVNTALHKLKNIYDIISIDPPFIIYKENPYYIKKIFFHLKALKLIDKNSLIFLEEPTYSKRDKAIEGFFFKNKRKYGSCNLLEYLLK